MKNSVKCLFTIGMVLSAGLSLGLGGASAQAGEGSKVECRHGTENGVPFVSVMGGGNYDRVYFSTYRQRDAAESKCLSLYRDCSMTTVRISNGDADGLGQHYNTYSEVQRYMNGFSSSVYSSYDRCLSRLVDAVVDVIESMDGERAEPSTRSSSWGLLPNGKPNPLSPINKL